MNYYETLVKHVNKAMKARPRSTIVMDAESFQIVASGTDAKKISRKLRASKKPRGVSVVFQNPGKNAVWILPSHSQL